MQFGEFDKLTITESGMTHSTADQAPHAEPRYEMQIDTTSAVQAVPKKIVATQADLEESAKIEHVLREDYHQFESVADRNKKR